MKRYSSEDAIPDRTIRAIFGRARSVDFLAKPFNAIGLRSVTFGNLGWWLPLTRVLPLVGITPQALRPVFKAPQVVVDHKGREKVYKTRVPKQVKRYDQLGAFALDDAPFKELAKVFGKAVRVLRDDMYGPYLMFTVLPSEEIIEAPKA